MIVKFKIKRIKIKIYIDKKKLTALFTCLLFKRCVNLIFRCYIFFWSFLFLDFSFKFQTLFVLCFSPLILKNNK
jgi:hypothetical protein